MRVYLMGDSHADTKFIARSIYTAIDYECHYIVQLGDFGYWPRWADGQRFLESVSTLLVNNDINLVFVPGNHEDHDSLNALDGHRSPEGFVRVLENLYTTTMVNNWSWGNTSFGALGGAFSIDYKQRTPSVDWFFDEQPTQAHVDALQPCDVLFSHEGPLALLKPLPDPILNDQATQPRLMIQQALTKTSPSIQFHGHWHLYKEYEYNEIQVVALGANVNRFNGTGAILDTNKKRWWSLYNLAYETEGNPW